ncbi:hypothetical protein C8R47DRAFT_472608 [Mycena vitilis]|nr:hypothetical protein C8R47DRAFT_472608 [Mycena vitilis]
MPSKIWVQCLFFDKIHRLKYYRTTLVISEAAFAKIRVAEFLLNAEDRHKEDCALGKCTACKSAGYIHVKSAWIMECPIATAFTTTQNMSELVSDESTGLQPMTSHYYLLQYVKSSATILDAVTVIFDCTFIPKRQAATVIDMIPPAIRVYASGSTSPTKRARPLSPSDAENKNHDTVKKPKLELTWPEGLHVIPSSSPDTPLTLLPPSFSYPSIVESKGVILIDKSKFIPKMCAQLIASMACVVALPPQTGKTTLSSMVSTFLDCQCHQETWDQLFRQLEVGHEVRTVEDAAKLGTPAPKWFRMARNCPCLLFDLKKADKFQDDRGISRAIKAYLVSTMEAFVGKYQAELGLITFTASERSSPPKMILKIFEASQDKKRNIFIAVDHWDAPILDSLEFLGDNPSTSLDLSVGVLTQFIRSLLAPIEQVTDAKTKPNILVTGNLPLFNDRELGLTDSLKHLTDLVIVPGMDGAFGITRRETMDLATVLSENRDMNLNMMDEGWDRRFGLYIPPPYCPRLGPHVPEVLNMELVFHHIATELGLDSKHRTLAESSSLKTISVRCKPLLEQSTLRRERPKRIEPFYGEVQGISFATLRTFAKHETGLEMFLVFLGAITPKNDEFNEDIPWIVELCSLFAQKQLFSLYAVIDNLLEESNRDKDARSLLERDPYPMLATMRRWISRKPLADVYNMNEAVFQTMFDCLWEDDSNDGNLDPFDDKWEPGRYLHNYVAQLGLCTDPTRLPSAKGKGKETMQPANPSGPSMSNVPSAQAGMSCDCSCRTCVCHCHETQLRSVGPPTAKSSGTVKPSTTAQTKSATAQSTKNTMVRSPTAQTNSTTVQKKGTTVQTKGTKRAPQQPVAGPSNSRNQVAVAPKRVIDPAKPKAQEAPQPPKPGPPEPPLELDLESVAGLGPYGYADAAVFGLHRVRRGRALVAELKYVSLRNLFCADYPSHTFEEIDDLIYGRGDGWSSFRYKCLKKIEALDSLPLPDLLDVKYTYWCTKEKRMKRDRIGKMLDKGVIQLRSYLNAIACGPAGTDSKGITRAEKRVKVTRVKDAADADELLGYVICGIGRRIISIAVGPDVQNTEYQFSISPGGFRTHENKSSTYLNTNMYYVA